MMECHFCGEAFQKMQAGSLAKCCMKRCNKYYCIECIKHFNPEFDMQMYRKETWICFSCQEICNCDKCKRSENAANDRKTKKKNPPRPRTQEESIELSNSNPTPLPTKHDTFPPAEQDPEHALYDQLPEEMEQEAAEFKTFTEEEMSQFPPFYRKIAERRNLFYNFAIQQARAGREEGGQL